jgi:hypothetical protein
VFFFFGGFADDLVAARSLGNWIGPVSLFVCCCLVVVVVSCAAMID